MLNGQLEFVSPIINRILPSVHCTGLLFTNVSQTTYCIRVLCFQEISSLDEETLSSLMCICMFNIINNELQGDLVYCI
jgi:hypothetical protein